MSFLLQEPTRQNSIHSGGRKRLSQENSKNKNTATRNIVSDNSRIFPGIETTGFNRGNRMLSQQHMSGNQIMLQRQKRRTIANKLQKQQHHQHERQKENQQEQPAKQEQDNLGDYTMDRVMADLHILERQQREAKRKLMSAQTTKQKRLDQLRQLNTLLENKNYSNGALRAKLRQSHEFLSIATRNLGERKLTTDRLQDGIADFECKLKKGLQSAKMIQVCVAKIDSFLIVIEHKVANMSRLRMEKMQISVEIRQKYQQTEEKDGILRLAIQDAHKRARKWGEEKASLSAEIGILDNHKMVAQNTEQTTELQIQCVDDNIKAEADRIFSLKRTLISDIEEATKLRETVSSKIKAGSTCLQALKFQVKGHQEKIIECRKLEGYSQTKDVSPAFDQRIFRRDLARIEEETKKDEDELLKLKKKIEDTELASKISNEKTLQNGKEASLIIASAKSLTAEEEKWQKLAGDFQVSLEYARAEAVKLAESFQEMEGTRESEVRANSKAVSGYDVETRHRIKMVEDLKLKLKLEDTSLRTIIRLFEDTEKLPMLKKLEETKDKSLSEEKKYQDLVDISSKSSIESKLQADFQPKIEYETTIWETKNKNMISRCNKHIQIFPCLQNIDCRFDKDKDRDKQIKTALVNVERDCAARKITAEAINEQEDLARKERKLEVEAMRAKLKEKEEAQALLKRRQFLEKSNRRVVDAKIKDKDAQRIDLLEGVDKAIISSSINDTFERRQRRRRKGSDFFDPRREGDMGMDNDLTPTNPRQLISSFLSQSSGQRVRWVDDHGGGSNDGSNGVNDKKCMESRSKDRKLTDSFRNIHEKKTKSKGIVKPDSSCTIIPVATNTNEQKSHTSERDIDFSEMKKQPSDTGSGHLGGTHRSRSNSKSLRNKNNKRGRSTSKYLDEDDDMEVPHGHKVVDGSQSDPLSMNMTFPFDDNSTSETINKDDFNDSNKKDRNRLTTLGSKIDNVTPNNRKRSGSEDEYIGLQAKLRNKSDHLVCERVSLPPSKTTSLESIGKRRKTNARNFCESGSTRVLKGRNKSSSSIRKDKLNGLSLSLKDSKDMPGVRKSSSENARTGSREKIRRKSNHEDIGISSFKEFNAEKKTRRITRDMNKVRPRKLEGRTSGIECQDKSDNFDIVLSENKKGGKKSTYNTSRRTKETEKRCGKTIDCANDDTSLRAKAHNTKSYSNFNKNRKSDKETSKEGRCPSTDVDRDNISFHVKFSRANRDKLTSVERDFRGKDREKSKCSTRETATERGARKESRKKNHVNNSIGKCGSSSRLVDSKESKNKVREISKGGVRKISSVQDITEGSREKTRNKSDQSTLAITKDSYGKARGKSGSRIRKKLSAEGTSKQINEKDRNLSNNDVNENEYLRGEDIIAHESLNARTSSSSQGNGTLKKRKIKGKNASVSSSKTNVTARRRKKRNTGLAQRSTTTNVRDESCDFNFQ